MSKCPKCGKIVIDLLRNEETDEIVGCKWCYYKCPTCNGTGVILPR